MIRCIGGRPGDPDEESVMADTQVARRSYASDIVVIVSMISVAGAVLVGLIVELGLAPRVAAALTVTGLLATITSHLLLRRNESLASPRAEIGGGAGPEMDEDAVDPFAPAGARREPKLVSKPSPDNAAETDEDGLARLRVPPVLQPVGADDGKPKREARAAETVAIEGIIRRLAEDIESGRQPEADTATANAAQPQPLTAEDFGIGQEPPAPPPLPHQATHREDRADDRALEPADAADRLAAVAEALSKERIEVFLEPIHGLADRQARHYEVTIRLTLEDGNQLGHDAYSSVTAGTALLPLIDAVKVSQAKKVGMHLLRRGQSGALISQINGQSVSGDDFSADLATIMGHDQIMAGRLVLSFAQNDLRGFSPGQWAAIDRIGQIGFRFAVDDITSLDMDFEMLGRKGFAFAKLDADVFANGLPAGQVLVPPTDVCRHLAGAGLTLIVDHLNDDRQLAEVLGFGALFGKGELFAAPRPVKSEALGAAANSPLANHAEMR